MIAGKGKLSGEWEASRGAAWEAGPPLSDFPRAEKEAARNPAVFRGFWTSRIGTRVLARSPLTYPAPVNSWCALSHCSRDYIRNGEDYARQNQFIDFID